MGKIDSQTLFITTSPRTPQKMVPEIDLLVKHFEGQVWNVETQKAFMEVLREEQYFNGQGEKDPAFSARDRINRAPKALGFVTLSPTIGLTPAGKSLLTSRHQEDVFLRQMIKFQVPSPYHKPSEKAAKFCVKPYLEMLRLVRVMGTLKFDELQIFGMQLTDWHDFDKIVKKIETFRLEKAGIAGNYRQFKHKYLLSELRHIYKQRIKRGETKTRESSTHSLESFLKTQANNMRDYADACFRYLRATGLVNVSHVGKSLSIVPERMADVDYILENVDREPCFVDDERRYAEYIGNASLPCLFTDIRDNIVQRLKKEFPDIQYDIKAPIDQLKDLLFDKIEKRKQDSIQQQVNNIKNYKLYDEIQDTFQQIEHSNLYDAPLMLEWNTWRAMTMLDGGNITANLKFDDFGKPNTTAAGNMPDIVCDYGEYLLSVEVTMASGQKQYDMEGEPVSRHLGKLKKQTDKPCYCLFVAPVINEACVAHFYTLHKTNITYYGGKSIIVPITLKTFCKMLEDSYKASYTPNPSQVRKLFERSAKLAEISENEKEWFSSLEQEALSWLA